MRNLNNSKMVEIEGITAIKKARKLLISLDDRNAMTNSEWQSFITRNNISSINFHYADEFQKYTEITKEREAISNEIKIRKSLKTKISKKITRAIFSKIIEDECSKTYFLENAIDFYFDNQEREINLVSDYDNII